MNTYEKKYKETLERAKTLYENANGMILKKWVEQVFPELAESEDEKIRQKFIKLVKMSSEVGGFALHKWEADEMLAWLEKQSEQKTTNKVEPKFKVGDWITDGYCKCQITFIDSSYWYSETCVLGGVESINNTYHLWTINDAKDGDVLISENDYPFIYAGNHIYTKYLTAYCGITNDGEFKISDKTELWTNDNVKPATKEHRDLLFQEICKAGYEWDANKKKLKKIEDEEYNGEDYGIDSLFHAQRILEKTLGKVDGYQTDDGILSHKCAINAIKKLYEQKHAEWTDEDESIANDIKLAVSSYWYEDTENNILDWLKSLKDRVQPQSQPVWSEEDEDNLNLVIYHIRCDDIPYSPHDVEPIVDWLNSIKQRLVGDDYERK